MTDATQLIDAYLAETTTLGKLAKKYGGKGKAIKGKQSRFTFDDKKQATKFAAEVGGKVLTFKYPTSDDSFEVRIIP